MINYYITSGKHTAPAAGFSVHYRRKLYTLQVEHFSQARIETPWSLAHRHPMFHFILYLTPGEHEVSGKRYELSVNDILLVGADEPHRFLLGPDGRPCDYYEITFQAVSGKTPLVLTFAAVMDLLFPGKSSFPDSHAHRIAGPFTEHIRSIFLGMPQYAAGAVLENRFGPGVAAGLIECLSELNAGVRDQNNAGKRSQKVEAMVRFIHLNYHRAFTLDELAEHCGCNPQYASRVFNREMRVTIADFTNRLRIGIAAKMLATGEYRVREAARAVGFADEFYFTKVFTRLKGYTPARNAVHI
ncbi:MAG: helix-turn-helix transcriptional regulator [Spirochaetes bacterium]|nr:helix-turn-helix transcriptional regulator [Spirochaetota bacterium]